MWRVFYCQDVGGEAGVKYTKPALSFEQQADQLLQRGFQADRARLIETLSRVSYYRLSAYWHPFKRADETFAPGTTLDKVWRRYTFDWQLRLLVMDAIERVEAASFGTLFTFYRYVNFLEQKQPASELGLPANVLQSWLFCLNYIRNLCAHHSRLWNRGLGIRPLIRDRKNAPHWHLPATSDNRRTFAVLTLLRWLLRRIALQSQWAERLRGLLKGYPDIPLNLAGFPAARESSPIWK